MARHNVSRAGRLFSGSANMPNYENDACGIEWHPQYRWRPTGIRAATATAVIALGDTTCTLTGNWAGATGFYPLTLSSGQQVQAYLVNGTTAVKFYLPAPQQGNPQTIGAVAAATTALIIGGQPPVVGAANSISLTQAIATPGGSALLNGANAGTLDVPRNVVAAWTTASTLTITGLDQYGNVMSEALATPGGSTGKKAFAVITSVKSSAAITALTVGTGNVLGLPFRVSSGDLGMPMFNDASDAGTFVPPDLTIPATTTTGDVRGTYAPAGTLNGAKFLMAALKVADPTSQFGAFGVAQV